MFNCFARLMSMGDWAITGMTVGQRRAATLR